PVEVPVDDTQEALRFLDVVLERSFVLVFLSFELIEVPDLAEHRTDETHLEHHPLDRVIAASGVLRDEAPALVGEIQQDRARLEQGERLATRPVRVDDRRY